MEPQLPAVHMEGGFNRQDTAVGVLLIPAISRAHETILSYSETAVR